MKAIRSLVLFLGAGLLPATEAAGVVTRVARTTSSGMNSGCTGCTPLEADVTGDSLLQRSSSKKHIHIELVDDDEEEELAGTGGKFSQAEPDM
mmetsp:Transcript_1993/g.4407  ORF Transcript_1993/g.4407 Transcript_1993/m.4407 type:complete len:93 (+) Transcript_1993:83-361(+)